MHLLFSPQCSTDGDCPRGRFCHSKFGHRICELCLDCPGRFRRRPSRGKCAKSANECGECIDGFAAEQLTQRKVRDKCVPVATVADIDKGWTTGSIEDDDSATKDALAIGAFVTGLIILVFGCVGCTCYVTIGYFKRRDTARVEPGEGRRKTI